MDYTLLLTPICPFDSSQLFLLSANDWLLLCCNDAMLVLKCVRGHLGTDESKGLVERCSGTPWILSAFILCSRHDVMGNESKRRFEVLGSYGRILPVEGTWWRHCTYTPVNKPYRVIDSEGICLYCCPSLKDHVLDQKDEFVVCKCFRIVYLIALLFTYRLETTMSTASFDPWTGLDLETCWDTLRHSKRSSGKVRWG